MSRRADQLLQPESIEAVIKARLANNVSIAATHNDCRLGLAIPDDRVAIWNSLAGARCRQYSRGRVAARGGSKFGGNKFGMSTFAVVSCPGTAVEVTRPPTDKTIIDGSADGNAVVAHGHLLLNNGYA